MMLTTATPAAPYHAAGPATLPATPLDASTTAGFLLQQLASCGPMTSAELAESAQLNTRLVWGLLKAARARGQVTFDGALWRLSLHWQPEPIAQAASLLRAAGWHVQPPNAAPAAPRACSVVTATFTRLVDGARGVTVREHRTVADATIAMPREAMATADFMAAVRSLAPAAEGWRLVAYSLQPVATKGGAL